MNYFRFIFILSLSLSFSVSFGEEKDSEKINYARKSMAYYGLFNCISYSYEDLNEKELSKLENDIMLSSTRYSMFNRGMYQIMQNQETLEDIYNPYKETVEFIISLSYKILRQKKLDESFNPIFRCLSAFESNEYKNFIKSIDRYIDISSINDLEYLNNNDLEK